VSKSLKGDFGPLQLEQVPLLHLKQCSKGLPGDLSPPHPGHTVIFLCSPQISLLVDLFGQDLMEQRWFWQNWKNFEKLEPGTVLAFSLHPEKAQVGIT
jgi:hypothetical protein